MVDHSRPAASRPSARFAGPVAPAPAAAARTADPFYEFRLTQLEMVVLPCAIVMAMALQCAPVLASPLAMPLIILMACMCWLSPITGLFYIACAQSLPFPTGAPLNPAQVGVLTWIPVALFRYRGLRFRGLKYLLVYLPYILWLDVLWEENLFGMNSEHMKALAYAVIACQLVNECGGRFLKCLLGLCLGALMVTNAYWGAVLGLPIQLSDWGGSRQEFARLGGARADSIMVWPPTLMAAFGVIGVAFSTLTRRDGGGGRGVKWLAAAVFLLTLPPLITTMSNAAYLGWTLMMSWMVVLVLTLKRRGLVSTSVSRRIGAGVIAVAMVVGMCYHADVLQVRSRLEALRKTYEEQSEEFGFAASRTQVWWASIQSIARHPLTGRAFALDAEDTLAGYEASGFFSHNVFLDAGRLGGVLGTTMLLGFFFFPSVRLWRLGAHDRYMGFYLFQAVLFLFWMVLSFPFYKTFWAFWMLMVMASDPELLKRPARAIG